MSLITKYTEIKVKGKNGKSKHSNTLILEEVQIWFDEQLWNLVKEYAGIYDFAINWNFKMSAHHYWVARFVPYFDKITQKQYKTIPEPVIRREFWKAMNAPHPDTDSLKMAVLRNFEMRFNDFKTPANLQIGDVICVSKGHRASYGKVTKKTEKTFVINLFDVKVVCRETPYAYADTEIYYKLVEAPIKKNQIIKSRHYSKCNRVNALIAPNGKAYNHTYTLCYN